MREARGVYYTPEPVVSYIVRSVDNLLKRDFLIPDGLADAGRVTLKNDKTELTYDDITHYQRIVAVLVETIRLMAAVDEAIAACGGWPIG